jgi:hypothetical protein
MYLSICLQSEALAGDPHHQGPVQLWGRLHAWHKLAQEHCSAEELAQMGMAGLEDEVRCCSGDDFLSVSLW